MPRRPRVLPLLRPASRVGTLWPADDPRITPYRMVSLRGCNVSPACHGQTAMGVSHRPWRLMASSGQTSVLPELHSRRSERPDIVASPSVNATTEGGNAYAGSEEAQHPDHLGRRHRL